MVIAGRRVAGRHRRRRRTLPAHAGRACTTSSRSSIRRRTSITAITTSSCSSSARKRRATRSWRRSAPSRPLIRIATPGRTFSTKSPARCRSSPGYQRHADLPPHAPVTDADSTRHAAGHRASSPDRPTTCRTTPRSCAGWARVTGSPTSSPVKTETIIDKSNRADHRVHRAGDVHSRDSIRMQTVPILESTVR